MILDLKMSRKLVLTPSSARSTTAVLGTPPRPVAQRLTVAYSEVAAGCFGEAAASLVQQRLAAQKPPSVSELAACQTFHQYDVDCDGYLSLPEMGKLLRDQGAAMDYQHAAGNMRRLTNSGEHGISLQCFLELFQSQNEKTHGYSETEINTLQKVFDQYDVNQSGRLEAKEYSRFLEDIGRAPRTKQVSESLGGLLASCRSTGTLAPLSFDEFIVLARRIDDEDGDSDRDEFFRRG